MSRSPTRDRVAEEDRRMLARQASFRRAAEVVTAELAMVPEVRAITLFGSVARPLEREVPRFQPFRHHRIEVLHECKDIDLAAVDRSFRPPCCSQSRAKPSCRQSLQRTPASAWHITKSKSSCSGKDGTTIAGACALTGSARRGRSSASRLGAGANCSSTACRLRARAGRGCRRHTLVQTWQSGRRSAVDAMRPDPPGRTSATASAK